MMQALNSSQSPVKRQNKQNNLTDYFTHVGEYFGLTAEEVLQTVRRLDMIPLNSTLAQLQPLVQDYLGSLERSLTTLRTVKAAASGLFDCVVKVLIPPTRKKYTTKKGTTGVLVKTIVADNHAYAVLTVFNPPQQLLQVGSLIRLHNVYWRQDEKYGNSLELGREGQIFPVPFALRGFDRIAPIPTLSVDQIGEYLTAPEFDRYRQELGIVNVVGFVAQVQSYQSSPSKVTSYVQQPRCKIILQDTHYQIDFIAFGLPALTLAQIPVTTELCLKYVRVETGTEALILQQTPFTLIELIHTQTNTSVSLPSTQRYELPTQRMSLREMVEYQTVVETTAAVLSVEELPAHSSESKPAVSAILYDLSGLVQLYTTYTPHQQLLTQLSPHTSVYLRGLYPQRSSNSKPHYLPRAYLRPTLTAIELLPQHSIEPPLTPLALLTPESPPTVSQGVVVKVGEVRSFTNSQTRAAGQWTSFTVQDSQNTTVTVRVFTPTQVAQVQNLIEGDTVRVWAIQATLYREKLFYKCQSWGIIEVHE